MVAAEDLLQFCKDCFLKLGVPEAGARLVAENLVFANLRGVDSHGVVRMKTYAARIQAGGFKAEAQPEIVRESESCGLIDGHLGMGQIAAMAAMELAIAKAHDTGIGFVTVKSTNHFGAAAFYALRALGHGMVGVATCNAGASMAPTGGKEPRLGNNPMAVVVPTERHSPLVLDMATGAAAWGKIILAQQAGQQVPSTWALDRAGNPTSDPNTAMDARMIQPIGGYKGYGISMMIDVLTGVLSGGGFSRQVKSVDVELDRPADIAHTFVALRIESFIALSEFKRRVDTMIDLMHTCPLATDVERIFVAGEIEHEMEMKRRVEGIPLGPQLLDELRQLGGELGIDVRI